VQKDRGDSKRKRYTNTRQDCKEQNSEWGTVVSCNKLVDRKNENET
jgi:hypothetical protein